ncbi:MAG: hypothetical protein HC863_02760 [Myxococcales bacterium]|nr:hypothetical protein [Myxococcales bacterium]
MIETNANKIGSHNWNDKYERNQKPKRDLDTIRDSGINVSIAPDQLELLQTRYAALEQGAFFLDALKKDRVVTINGFDGSKTSLIAHDFFDHLWLFDRLDSIKVNDSSLMELYGDFFQSVGNPQATDMFKREGELTASVSYNWRASHGMPDNYRPRFSKDRIARALRASVESGNGSPNQARVLEMLDNMDNHSATARQLEWMVEMTMVELMEQTRKAGRVRTLDENFDPVGFITTRDPEYLALIADIQHVLNDRTNRAKEALVNIEAMTEQYFQSVAKTGNTADPLILTPENVNAFDPDASDVSPETLDWLRNNIGYNAYTMNLKPPPKAADSAAPNGDVASTPTHGEERAQDSVSSQSSEHAGDLQQPNRLADAVIELRDEQLVSVAARLYPDNPTAAIRVATVLEALTGDGFSDPKEAAAAVLRQMTVAERTADMSWGGDPSTARSSPSRMQLYRGLIAWLSPEEERVAEILLPILLPGGSTSN